MRQHIVVKCQSQCSGSPMQTRPLVMSFTIVCVNAHMQTSVIVSVFVCASDHSRELWTGKTVFGRFDWLISFVQWQYRSLWGFNRGAIIASWKLYPIPRLDDRKVGNGNFWRSLRRLFSLFKVNFKCQASTCAVLVRCFVPSFQCE